MYGVAPYKDSNYIYILSKKWRHICITKLITEIDG